MSRAAARIKDKVLHPLPSALAPGPGSPNVLIGGLCAWRGVPVAAVAGLESAKTSSDTTIQAAEAATKATGGIPPAFPAALQAEQTAKTTALSTMSSTITSAAAGADIHNCTTPSPVPPHGPGVVIDGSKTVLINGLPACRMGDTIIEALGLIRNKIVGGDRTVLIGG